MTLGGKIVVGIVALFAVAQVVPIERSNPPVTGDVGAPPDVAPVLRRACYDCHSNETGWPWYSRIAPASWLLAYDVAEGRRELNYSEWSAYPPARQQKKMKETVNEIAEGEMPPWYFVVMHPDARLAQADKDALTAWARGLMGQTP
jgi:heme-binding protein